MIHCFSVSHTTDDKLEPVHEYWPGWLDGCTSSLAGSSSTVWKLGLDQSKPWRATNSASSSIKPDGLISGAKVCLRIGGIKSITLYEGVAIFLLSASKPDWYLVQLVCSPMMVAWGRISLTQATKSSWQKAFHLLWGWDIHSLSPPGLILAPRLCHGLKLLQLWL